MIRTMKQKVVFLFVCIMILFSSCSVMKKSTSTSINVNSGVYQYPTVADLNVKQKIEKVVTWNFVLFNWGQPSLELRKSNMIADIIKENDADILLEPQMTFTKTPYGKRTLVITGFPASFKDFRKATVEDLKALEVTAPVSQKDIYNVAQPWYKKIFSKIK